MTVHITRVSHFLPDRVVTNDAIIAENSLKMRGSWVERFIGVRERRWTPPGTAASDLAVEAIRSLALGAFEGPLYVSTVSPDYLTPSTASEIKRKLEWTSEHPALDVNAACAGLLFALELAMHRLEASGEERAVVVATEVRSRFLDPLDRKTVFLFGDGASALLVERRDRAGGIEWIHSVSVPSEGHDILVPAGGSVEPLSEAVLAARRNFITMLDGPKIVEMTTEVLVQAIRRVLSSKGREIADYDFFLFHQGNASIAGKIGAALGIPSEKTLSNFDRYGNVSSASVGICLSELVLSGRVAPGQRVLLVAMGAGYHVSLASVVWTA